MYEGIKGAILLSVIAMVVVFTILSLLALLMVGLRKVVQASSKKDSKEEQVSVKKEDTVTVPFKEKETVSSVGKYDEELISVISAAIASYLNTTPSLQSANVINIKRITPQTLNPWAISGRQKIMTERTSISTRKKGGV